MLLSTLFLVASATALPAGGKIPNLKGQALVDYVNRNQNLFKAVMHKLSSEEERFHLMGKAVRRIQKVPMPETDTVRDADMPASFDSRTVWSDCSSISTIHEQANCGSCWAISSASIISDRICIATNGQDQVQVSAADILSCCRDCGAGCGGGVPLLAMQWWHSDGVVTGGDFESGEGCKPYPFGHPAGPGIYNETAPQCTSTCTNANYPTPYEQDKHFGSIYYELPPTTAGIQREIMTHGPVVTCFEQYADFNHYQSGIYVHTAGDYVGIHCVKVLGWGVDNGTPYWLAANSRGPTFGENGMPSG